MSIGRNSPLAERIQHAEESLTLGVVLRCHARFITPPKTKIFVVIGMDDNGEKAAVVLINSNPARMPDLAPYQMSITKEGRSYIQKDCFVDCSRIYVRPLDLLRGLITKSPNVVLGHVSPEDHWAMRKLAGNSEVILPSEKKLFHLK